MNVLHKIGGSNGDVRGDLLVQPVYHEIIELKFSASISWSGRAGRGKGKKIALSKYDRIVRMIASICNKADEHYTTEKCTRDLKYKVIKYSQSRFGESDNESEIE